MTERDTSRNRAECLVRKLPVGQRSRPTRQFWTECRATDTPMNFHDATLLSVQADWAQGSAVVVLRVAGLEETVEVCAVGVTDLRLSREHPWGPSVSVDSMHVTGGVITIEMQSGDTITIAAQSFDAPAT